MRELHTFSDQQIAARLSAFLTSHLITNQVEQEQGEWTIWIVSDDQRQQARQVLETFLDDPYSESVTAAITAVKKTAAPAEQRRSTSNESVTRRLRERWDGVWYRCFPLTVILIGLSILVVALTTDWKASLKQGGLFFPTCNNPESELLEALFIQPAQGFQTSDNFFLELFRDPAKPDPEGLLKSGQYWRPITPIFLHFGVLHIFFNMHWMWGLGRYIEFVRGTWRFGALVFIVAIVSNVAQLYWSGPNFGGMSGVVFGLMGYAWMKGKTQPYHGIGLSQDQVVYSIFFMVMCMAGIFGNVANACHLAGFVTGIMIGARQAIWKKLLNRREE
jgi:GlpG protein